LLRLPYTDCTSGYRGYRTQTLRDRARLERLKSEGYSMLVEILYQIHRSGARIAEHPIIYHERREGMSKMSNKVILESIVNPFRFWFKIGFPAGGGGRAHKS
jgi:dolichol-phosphate mannosyltransferase